MNQQIQNVKNALKRVMNERNKEEKEKQQKNHRENKPNMILPDYHAASNICSLSSYAVSNESCVESDGNDDELDLFGVYKHESSSYQSYRSACDSGGKNERKSYRQSRISSSNRK